jgi:hypothetical protein
MQPVIDERSPTGGTARRAHYRSENGLRAVDLTVGTTASLFSGLDPSPPGQRDLAPEIQSYIVDAVTEIGGPAQAKIVIHLPAAELARAEGVGDAVRHFFTYRAWAATQDLRRLLRTGYASLAIGVLFLIACLALRGALQARVDTGLGTVFGEGLVIVGWVALWRPLETFLYDWWPIWRRRRFYEALGRIAVECRAQGG